jgi:hypothetical protein
MLLALFILMPVALVAAAAGMAALRIFGLLPAGVSKPLAYGLLSTICLGLLFLCLTVDDLVLRPARLQKELVGQQLGSLLQLRRYEAYGFQDPYYEWRYSLNPELIRKLKRKCRPLQQTPAAQCLLAKQDDGSWWQGIGLEGDVLWVVGHDS